MTAWILGHAAAFGTALGRLGRHPFAAMFEIMVLGVALSLPVGLILVVETARGFAAQMPSAPEISVYVDRGVRPATVETLSRKLKGLPDVLEVRFVGRQEAADQLRKTAGMGEVLDALADNPLPDAFTLRLSKHDPVRVEELKTTLAQWPGVDIVQADSGWARKVDTGIRVARSSVLVLGVLFAVAALSVTFNTVRLQMLGRRDEIQLSRLIGATDGFVRRPFVYFGALQGALGGAGSLVIVAAARYALTEPLADFSTAYGIRIVLPEIPSIWVGAFLGTTALLGATAAWIAATRHLWTRELR